MVRASNKVIGLLNILTLLLSVPIIGVGFSLRYSAHNECESSLQIPAIAFGSFLLLLSVAGFLGACGRVSWLLWLYLFAMFIVIVLLFCFSIFAFVVTNYGSGQVVSGRAFKEYQLDDYSKWLQDGVNDEGIWRTVRSCLRGGDVCKRMEGQSQSFDEFVNSTLTPLQSGCCKPPTACNFTYKSPTVWVEPSRFNHSDDSDCNTWQSNSSVLCYDCQSCKAGFVATIKVHWKKIADASIFFIVFLIIVYSVGCCAFRNTRRDNVDNKFKACYR